MDETEDMGELLIMVASIYAATDGKWFKAIDLDPSVLTLTTWLQYRLEKNPAGFTRALGWALGRHPDHFESRADGKHGRLYRVKRWEEK